MPYANYAEVVEAIDQAVTKQQLCDIADDTDNLSMTRRIVMTDEDWNDMTSRLQEKDYELSE